MGLKAVIDNLDNVPEALREFYAESDGKYVLAVQGMVSKDKVDEFRTNNIELQKQMDTLKATVDGLDMDKYNELIQKQQDDQFAQMIKDGKIDELIDLKTKSVTDHFNSELEKANSEKSSLTKQLEALTIDGKVKEIAVANGIAPTALADVMLRAKSTFKLEDGQAVPYDGDKVMYAAGTTDPMSVEGWVKGLSESAPHLFAPSSGGGSQHGNQGGGGKNTVQREQFDQMSQFERAKFVKDGGKVA